MVDVKRSFIDGERVVQARKEKALTQREMAAALEKIDRKIPYSWVASVESGRLKRTEISRLATLARVLGKPLEYFTETDPGAANVALTSTTRNAIPVYGDVSAERFQFSFDATPESSLNMSLPVAAGKKVGAWRVKGDCMQGTAEDGDYVIAVEAHDVANGSLAIVRHNGEYTFKRVRKYDGGRVELCPDNKRFKKIEVRGGRFEVVAEVVWVVKKP